MNRRPVRETLAILLGVYGIVHTLTSQYEHRALFLALYAAATLGGLLRLWPARAIGVGVALGTLVQWIRVGDVASWPWYVWLNVAALGLLCSSELAARYEGSPSRWRWLPNPWADLPPSLVWRLRLCLYATGVLASLLFQQGLWSGTLSWSSEPLVIVALGVCIAILALGRAAALVPLSVLSGALVVELGRLSLGQGDPSFYLASHARLGAGMALASALAVTVLALPHAWLLVRARRL